VNAADLRASLGHPVIDCDGHWLEPVSIFLDFLRGEVGGQSVDRYVRGRTKRQAMWSGQSPEERLSTRQSRPVWWMHPTNTYDRATAMLPGLMYDRLDEFGIDFAFVYSSLGLALFREPDDELRIGGIRALNRMNAEIFGPYAGCRSRLHAVSIGGT
jgi:hypothetical protein